MQERQTKAAPEVLREELTLQRFVSDGLSQAVVEGEIALPGGLREETRVLLSEAMAVLENASAEAGKVTAEGRVTFHVLYTQGDPTRISALEASADFTHPVEMEGAQPGMIAPVSLMVEHVEAAAQGGRLHLMAILRVHCRVFSDEPMSVVTGVRGAEGLMLRTDTLSGCQTVARGQQDALIRDECELADVLQISDTLYATACVTVQDVMGGEDKATVSGNIQLEVTHLSHMPQRPLVITRHAIPFEETLALSGEGGDALCVSAVVKDVAVLSQEGSAEGERTLRSEVLLGLSAHATRDKQACLLLDAYTTQGDALELNRQTVQRALSHRQLHTAESGKMTLLTDGQPPVRTPLRAALRPVITELSSQNGKTAVEGMMEVTLLYMTDDTSVPQSWQTEEPFRLSFAADVAQPESIILSVDNVDVNAITSDRVEVKYILHLDDLDVALSAEPLVTQVSATPAEAPQPGILLYFSQSGESLWDIAKRYRVSCDSLRALNPSLADDGQPHHVILRTRTQVE